MITVFYSTTGQSAPKRVELEEGSTIGDFLEREGIDTNCTIKVNKADVGHDHELEDEDFVSIGKKQTGA